jgi:glycosyltransferase involved in cell wall biosynthesis
MKILLTVDPEIPVPPHNYGGIERVVDMLVNQYVQKGHEVTLCANRISTANCTLVGWHGNKSQDKWDMVKNTYQLTKLICCNRFEVLHSFSRLAYMTTILSSSLPKVMSYQREPGLNQVKKANFLKKKGSLVFTGCSDYITHQIATIAVAQTIYNGVPVNNYTATENAGEDAPLIFLGRVEPIKGADIAVQLALKANRRLIIAGNIPNGYQSYFENNIRPFLSNRIEYVGPVNDKQKNELLGKSLALLMPIMWNEPFGIVMAEAMICGTPVLAFGKGAVPEIVTHGINGFISFSEREMLEQIPLCIGLDRKKIRSIAVERFGDDKISEDYLSLYGALVNHRRKNK